MIKDLIFLFVGMFIGWFLFPAPASVTAWWNKHRP